MSALWGWGYPSLKQKGGIQVLCLKSTAYGFIGWKVGLRKTSLGVQLTFPQGRGRSALVFNVIRVFAEWNMMRIIPATPGHSDGASACDFDSIQLVCQGPKQPCLEFSANEGFKSFTVPYLKKMLAEDLKALLKNDDPKPTTEDALVDTLARGVLKGKKAPLETLLKARAEEDADEMADVSVMTHADAGLFGEMEDDDVALELLKTQEILAKRKASIDHAIKAAVEKKRVALQARRSPVAAHLHLTFLCTFRQSCSNQLSSRSSVASRRKKLKNTSRLVQRSRRKHCGTIVGKSLQNTSTTLYRNALRQIRRKTTTNLSYIAWSRFGLYTPRSSRLRVHTILGQRHSLPNQVEHA